MNQEISKHDYAVFDALFVAHFDDQVAFLDDLLNVPSVTTSGKN